jgi:hypothetical protein
MADTVVESAQARLLQALRALGSPKRAEQEKRYQKSRWEHWGVSLPNMDVAIKETLGDLSQDEALDLCRCLWREPVWDLKIVAGRILARKSIAPDARVWGFVTERMTDLDGWAVADNLASVASRYLIEDPRRLDAVETWIESPPAAQYNLGTLYEKGLGGLPTDDREAARLYRLAADRGDNDGQFRLGQFYANGRGGLPKDESEAARLFKLSAGQGHALAQDALTRLCSLTKRRFYLKGRLYMELDRHLMRSVRSQVRG